MQQVDAQLEALEKHKKLIREHREKETKLRERKLIIFKSELVIIFSNSSAFRHQGLGKEVPKVRRRH